MANNLNTEITGRWVVIKEGSFKPEYKPLHWRIWRAEGGFGCHSVGDHVVLKDLADLV